MLAYKEVQTEKLRAEVHAQSPTPCSMQYRNASPTCRPQLHVRGHLPPSVSGGTTDPKPQEKPARRPFLVGQWQQRPTAAAASVCASHPIAAPCSAFGWGAGSGAARGGAGARGGWGRACGFWGLCFFCGQPSVGRWELGPTGVAIGKMVDWEVANGWMWWFAGQGTRGRVLGGVGLVQG